MDYARFLFSFEGRINRARYWLATLIILCCMIFVLLLLAAAAGIFGIAGGPLTINIVGISASIQLFEDDPASKASLFPQLVTIPMTFVYAWSFAAVSIKRLHDRNKSGWWMTSIHRCDRSLRSIRRSAGRFLGGGVHWARRVHCLHLGLGRDVLPEGHARAQPVRGRSARADRN